MADFDGIISSSPDWVDIPSLSTSAIALGGTAGAGVMNAQAVALTKRTNYLINYSVQISPATGNAGIGTSSPIGRLQIGDSSANINNKIVFGKSQASTAANLPAIGQRSAGVANDLAIAATSSTGSVKIFTGNSTNSGEIGTGSNAERVIVNSLGEVGVGTSTPYQSVSTRGNISINGSASSILNLGVGNSSKAYIYSDGLAFSVWNVVNGALQFGTNNLVRATFGADGIFNKYVSSSVGTETVGIRFTDGTQNLGSIRSYNYSGYNQHLRFYTSNAGTETHAMTLDSSGNVGIGTTSITTGTKLDLRGMLYQNSIVSNTATNQHVFNANGNNYPAFYDAGLAGANGGLAIGGATTPSTVPSSATMFWNVNTNLVGIGTTAPGAKLDVVSTSGDVNSRVFANSTAGGAISTVRAGNGTTSSQYAYQYFMNDKTVPQAWALGTYGTDNFTIRDVTASANRLTISTGGNVGINQTSPDATLSVDGTIRVGVGSPTAAFKGLILASTMTDTFTTDTDKVVHHYGVTCKSFSDAPGAPVVTISGYNGIRHFTNGSEKLRITSTGDQINYGTGALKIHEGTTAQRPSTPTEGSIRKNSTLNVIEGYSGGDWRSLESGKLLNVRLFSTQGVHSSFTLDAKTNYIIVEMVGGGGGGGKTAAGPYATNGFVNIASSGGAGSAVKFLLKKADLQSTFYYYIGAGGAAGGAGGTGSDGAATILSKTPTNAGLSSYIQANGGYGGERTSIAAAPLTSWSASPGGYLQNGMNAQILEVGRPRGVAMSMLTNAHGGVIVQGSVGIFELNTVHSVGWAYHDNNIDIGGTVYSFGAGGSGTYAFRNDGAGSYYTGAPVDGFKGMIRVYEYS